jgi:hypothetical protein
VAPGEVRLGRADGTGLAPASVDTVVMRHVLGHNGGAEQRIVDHLGTLVRPGGCVYLLDLDLSVASLRPAPPAALELYARYARWHVRQGNDLRVGRRLPDLARGAGLDVVAHRSWTESGTLTGAMRGPAWAARNELVRAGLASSVDVARWDGALAALDDAPERPRYAVRHCAAVCRRAA